MVEGAAPVGPMRIEGRGPTWFKNWATTALSNFASHRNQTRLDHLRSGGAGIARTSFDLLTDMTAVMRDTLFSVDAPRALGVKPIGKERDVWTTNRVIWATNVLEAGHKLALYRHLTTVGPIGIFRRAAMKASGRPPEPMTPDAAAELIFNFYHPLALKGGWRVIQRLTFLGQPLRMLHQGVISGMAATQPVAYAAAFAAAVAMRYSSLAALGTLGYAISQKEEERQRVAVSYGDERAAGTKVPIGAVGPKDNPEYIYIDLFALQLGPLFRSPAAQVAPMPKSEGTETYMERTKRGLIAQSPGASFADELIYGRNTYTGKRFKRPIVDRLLVLGRAAAEMALPGLRSVTRVEDQEDSAERAVKAGYEPLTTPSTRWWGAFVGLPVSKGSTKKN